MNDKNGGLSRQRAEREIINAANDNDPTLADDFLRGASAIAEYLWGDGKLRRRVYHLYATSNAPIFFKVGSMICSRRSTINSWIAEAERRHGANRRNSA